MPDISITKDYPCVGGPNHVHICGNPSCDCFRVCEGKACRCRTPEFDGVAIVETPWWVCPECHAGAQMKLMPPPAITGTK